MDLILNAISEIRADIPWAKLFLGFFVILLGQVLLRMVDWVINSAFEDIKEKQNFQNMRKFSIYIYNIILFIFFLKITQVDMKVVLGATGLLTLAIGFAARTPISNLISGIFLVFERPFVVGDIIVVNEYRGEVVSLNLLSLTMRTLDNLMVRIPNELVIGTAVRNISYFPIRRLDINYVLSSRESLTRLQEIFLKVAARNELALDEPEPYFRVDTFKESSVEITFMVWAPSEDFANFQSVFPKEIHRAVKSSGIEPVRTLIEIHNTETQKEKSRG